VNETDQEQIESLKQFWAKWGNALIGAIVLLAVLMIGTNVWENTVRKNKEAVSDEYQLIVQLLSENAQLNSEQVLALTEMSNGMKHKYSDSVYTAYAAFNVASQLVESGDLDKALAEFNYVIENIKDSNIVELATDRKAKVLLEQGKLEEAYSAITSIEPKAMSFKFLSTQGDILVAQGKLDDAKQVYESAVIIGEEQGIAINYLRLKLSDLATVQ